MTYDEAKDFVMPIGKYRARSLTLAQIAEDEDDLFYLEWLKQVRDDDPDHEPDDLDLALEAFLEA